MTDGSIDLLYSRLLPGFADKAAGFMGRIWPGMQPCPVCLFRPGGPAWLYAHRRPPRPFLQHGPTLWRADQHDTVLFGSTQYRLAGQWTAVADYSDFSRPPEDILSELFHEMHHVYQREHMPHMRWEDPGMLITYPEKLASEVLKAWEGRQLLAAVLFEENGSAALARYAAGRRRRMELLGPEALTLEGRIETMEGPALYCQARCLGELEGGQWPAGATAVEVNGSLLRPLLHLSWGRDRLRPVHMARGLAMAVLLDRLSGQSWKQRLFDGEMLICGLIEEHAPPLRSGLPNLMGLRQQMSALRDASLLRRSRALEEFLADDGTMLQLRVPDEARVAGMDPMSATAVEPGLVLHPRFFRLEGPQGAKAHLEGVPALAAVDGSVWSPSELMFHIPWPECLERRQGRLLVDLPGLRVDWPSDMVKTGTEAFPERR